MGDKLKTSLYVTSDYLKDIEDQTEYLIAAKEEGGTEFMEKAFLDVVAANVQNAADPETRLSQVVAAAVQGIDRYRKLEKERANPPA